MNVDSSGDDPQVVAFYYPQFHQDTMNDRLYGVGFTEWDNVERAEPFFPGHRQPRVSAPPLGRYQLSDANIYAQQVELARQAGLSGFCFYHYWFTGDRRILERPLRNMLENDVDFPFCLMWANHDWTLAWRGAPDERVLEMTYAEQDPSEFVAAIADALRDPRYIRVDGRPLLCIYELDGPPDLSGLIRALQQAAVDQGIGRLFVAGVQRDLHSVNRFCPDLDALLEFPPHTYREHATASAPDGSRDAERAQFFDYRSMAAASLSGTNLEQGMKYFRCVTPDWDNTGRRMESRSPAIFLNSTPERFGTWARGLLSEAASSAQSLPLVFVNAWNEWGEAAYLEPDTDQGTAYIDALQAATSDWQGAPSAADAGRELLEGQPALHRRFFPDIATPTVAVAGPPSGPGATLWLDRINHTTPPFGEQVVVASSTLTVRGFVVSPAVTTNAAEQPEHEVFLVGQGQTYRSTVMATDRSDILDQHDGWVTASNVAGAGLEGVIDLSGVPAGSYSLVVPIGDRVGRFKATVQVTAQTEPASPAQSTRSTLAGLFEPEMNYSISLRPGSAHSLIQEALLQRGSKRVLDCGCADGSFGAALIDAGIETHGLEYDRSAVTQAVKRLASAQPADLENPSWKHRPAGQFDAVLFIDVLEHLRRPDTVLEQARSLVAPGGAIVASIPNVAHISRRVGLLEGDWTYQDWGLLDRTHLRFFTKASTIELFENAGYDVADMAYTAAPPAIRTKITPQLEELLGDTLHTPEAQAYQFIVTATLR